MSELSSMLNFRERWAIAFLALMALGLSGCATTANTPLARAQMKTPIRVLVVQAPMAMDEARLQAVLAPDINLALPIFDERLQQGMKHAQEHALAAMESALAGEPGLLITVPQMEEKQLIDHIQGQGLGSAMTQEEADRLQGATGADALLRFGITDYGLTPRSWRNGYIAFEVTSTLALAAVIAYSGSTAAKAAAGIYLAQETIEETAEAYAGFWAVDEVYRPVRIEAELIGLNPVTILWKTSDTGFSDTSLSRLVRKVGADERNRQLNQATDEAVKKIASDLSDTVEHKEPEP